MEEDNVKKKSEGLWIPSDILHIPSSILDPLGKIIFAHIYSFGKKGCFQSNETIAKLFAVSIRPISDRIANMKEGNLVYVMSPKSPFRTVWAKSHPDVQKAVYLPYRTCKIPKSELETGQETSKLLRQNYPSNDTENDQVTMQKTSKLPRQEHPATYIETNIMTNKETYRDTKSRASDNLTSEHKQKNNKYTLDKVIAEAEKLNISIQMAKDFYNYYNSQGWLRSNGLPITDLDSALENWKNKQRSFNNGNNESPPPMRNKDGKTPRQLDIEKRGGK